MRTSSVSEGAKKNPHQFEKAPKLHTPKLNTFIPREKCKNLPIYGIFLSAMYFQISGDIKKK